MLDLLSPVGDFDCLKAAVQNGADPAFVRHTFSAQDRGGSQNEHCLPLVLWVSFKRADPTFFYSQPQF